MPTKATSKKLRKKPDTRRKERPMTPRRAWLNRLVNGSDMDNKAFARSVKINYTNFTAMLTGRKPISDYTIRKIIAKYDVTAPSDFMTPLDFPTKSDFQAMKDRVTSLSMQVAQLTAQLLANKGRSQNGRKAANM